MSYIEGPHPLLECSSPAYSNATVRRAFIVWMHCGQRNTFKDVCNYYHRLESLEDKLPADRRATSRHHEFNMFSNPPPTSPYLNQTFPKLYSQNNTIQHYIKKVEDKHDSNLFKLECFNDKTGVSTNDIVDTSHMIKKYCKSHMLPIRKFLIEFKEYARKCDLNNTVNNVAFYIKRKLVEEELLMVENYSKSLNFLKLNSVEIPDRVLNSNNEVYQSNNQIRDNSPRDNDMKIKEDQMKFLSVNNQKQITVLTRDTKIEIINQYWNDLTCNYAELAVRNSFTRT